MEALADAVGLRALGLGARMINVLDRKVKLVFVSFGIAAEFAAAVGQNAQQFDLVLFEERHHSVIEQIRCGDRRLAIIELGEGHLGVGVDEGLLVDAAYAFEGPNVEGVLGTPIARMPGFNGSLQ